MGLIKLQVPKKLILSRLSKTLPSEMCFFKLLFLTCA